MKESFNRWWKEYFSFTRKERKGMLALAGILFLLLLANTYYSQFFPPDYPQITIQELPGASQETERTTDPTERLKPFDPNSANLEELIAGGFSDAQAESLIRYREAGGSFRTSEDLKKLYIMSDYLYARIQDKVRIQDQTIENRSTPVKEERPDGSQRSKWKPAPSLLININTVDSIGLVKVRGIGPKTAHRVLRYRSWLGGFSDTSQYREIWGVYPDQIGILQKQAIIDRKLIRSLAINRMDRESLQRHPYIRYKAKVIEAYRQQHGPYTGIDDLKKTRVLSDSLIQKLAPYLEF